MWVADPVALLNAAKGYLRPNGIIAFQESEFTFGLTTFPETPLFRQVAQARATRVYSPCRLPAPAKKKGVKMERRVPTKDEVLKEATVS